MVRGQVKHEMAKFQIMRIETPLFGAVEQSGEEPWYAEFSSSGTTTSIELDKASLSAVCDAIGLDGVGATVDAERYVNGEFSESADGIHGTSLGDFGEILTYLLLRSDQMEVVRIKSYANETNDDEENDEDENSKFPTPDFIVIRNGKPTAFEVKSTEGLPYVALRDKVKKWKLLQPCSSVVVCRKRALPQLGWIGGECTAQKHKLRQRDGQLVPFPSEAGAAVAVLAFDGRLDKLRGDAKKYKTPVTCRNSTRDCWTCVPSGQHLVHVVMPNSPGKLSFSGGGKRAIDVLRAYERWAQSLDAHDVIAAQDTLSVLLAALAEWFQSDEINEPDTLRDFWSVYLRDSMRARGMAFDLEMPSSTTDLARYGIAPRVVGQADKTREAEWGEFCSLVSQASTSAPRLQMVSAEHWDFRGRPVTISMSTSARTLDFHLMSHSWWEKRTIDDERIALEEADNLLSLVLEAIAGPSRYKPISALQMSELGARVGDSTVKLGWSLQRVHLGNPITIAYQEWWRGRPAAWRNLLEVLASGDVGARLTVHRDGRIMLRVEHGIFQSRDGAIA